jgi:FkbM family methyltransferase
MSITFKQLNDTEIDLSVSKLFEEHYNKSTSYTKYIIENEINTGLWDPEILKDILKEDAIVIDAGANVGLFSLYVLPLTKFICCVEPTPSHSKILEDILGQTKQGTQRIFIFEGALSNTNGTGKLSISDNNTTENKLSSDGIEIKLTTLSKLIEPQDHITLLKLDIEGAEQQVLFEDPTIDSALSKCENIYIECHQGVNDGSVINKLQALGFTLLQGKRGYFFRRNTSV